MTEPETKTLHNQHHSSSSFHNRTDTHFKARCSSFMFNCCFIPISTILSIHSEPSLYSHSRRGNIHAKNPHTLRILYTSEALTGLLVLVSPQRFPAQHIKFIHHHQIHAPTLVSNSPEFAYTANKTIQHSKPTLLPTPSFIILEPLFQQLYNIHAYTGIQKSSSLSRTLPSSVNLFFLIFIIHLRKIKEQIPNSTKLSRFIFPNHIHPIRNGETRRRKKIAGRIAGGQSELRTMERGGVTVADPVAVAGAWWRVAGAL